MSRRPSLFLLSGLPLVGLLAFTSLFVGVSDITPTLLWEQGTGGEAMEVLLASRVPRTLALMLAGAGLAVAGLLLQILVRNRFVEPTTVGTTESATLGILLVMLLAPGLPVGGKMLVAAAFGLAGTGLFLLVLGRVPLRSVLMVPLIGILLSGVIGAISTFIAYRTDLLQSLTSWTQGDFSVVLQGRYELLWLVGLLVGAAALAADRFTVAGLGRDLATGLGLNHRRVMALGLTLVALVSASVLVTVGLIPFLGLIVPNLASMAVGDNLRRTLPVSILGGMTLVLLCDILGRWVIHPFEIPIGATMGAIGSAVFLVLLLRSRARVA